MAKNQKTIERAREFRDMPAELLENPAGHEAHVIGGRLDSDFEHNVEFLAPRRRALMISRMLRTSPIIALGESYLTSRATAVEYHIDRAGKSDEVCDALESWLGVGDFRRTGGMMGQDFGFDDLVRHCLSSVFFGHVAIAESYRFDGDLYQIGFHRRRQESYHSYVMDKDERLIGIRQHAAHGAPANTRSTLIPLNECLWLVNRGDLVPHSGRSILRPCFGFWRSEQAAYSLLDLVISKYGDPPLKGTIDVERFTEYANGRDGAPPTRDAFDEEIRSMQNALTGLMSDESAHLLYPDFWSFKEIASDFNPSPILQCVSHFQRGISERLYIAWQTQGRMNDSGSRAMVSVQSEAVNDTTIDLCEYICTALNRQSIKRFLKINFSGLDESEYPTLSFAKASVKMPWWQRSSADFVNFIQAGVLSMTEEDERMIRMSSGLPPISDDDAPDALDRLANRAGGRLNTVAGQREARTPAKSKPTKNKFVNRLVSKEIEGDDDDDE